MADISGGIPKVELKGTPYQIGLAHGTLLRTQVLRQLAIYRDIFLTTCKFDWDAVRSVAGAFETTIGRLAPDLLEEMRGIAAGAEVDVLDVVALNARSEIALGQWDDGCTALAWRLDSTQLLAQNWDWRTAVGENLALASVRQEGKPDIWMVIEAGLVGKIGFNSASVGVCLNAIRAKPIDTSLLPIHVLLRLALESPSAACAIATIESLGGASSSQHILIADPAGARGLELSPRGGVYIDADASGLVVHTNHFLQNTLVHEPPWLPGSPVRLARARVLCADLLLTTTTTDEQITPALLRHTVFADTFNTPQAICCAPDPDRAESVETLFNIIMTFEAGSTPRAEVLFGRPTAGAGAGAGRPLHVMPW